MKYLHGFNLDTQFKDEYNDDEKYFEPWTSLTHENEEVHYNKKQAGEYLTFEILTGGELYLGEILYSELINAFENTIKNEDSNSNDYMYIDKVNDIAGVNEDTYPGSSKPSPFLRAAKNRALKYYDFLQEFPTLPGIKYSINGGEWTDWLINPETYYRTLTVSSGDIVRVKGDKSYINIFEGNDSWIDPRDIDNSIAKEVTRQSDTTTKDITITVDHQDIDFDSSIFGNLSDINSWYNSDLFSNLEWDDGEFDPYEEEEEEEENPVLPKNTIKRNRANISNFSTSINGNVFSYKGKIKYKFKNVTFNKINPIKLEEDTLINSLIGYTYDGTTVNAVNLIFPQSLSYGSNNNYLKKLLHDGVIKYSDIVSINDSDDPHIKYLSYNIYNRESYYTYTYYSYHENFTNTYIGLSVFGFLLFDDNENLIGFASINDTLETYSNIYDFLLPEKYFRQYIVDYIYNNDFSTPLEIVFNPEYFVPGYPGGGNPGKKGSSFPSILENSNWLFVFTYDIEYLGSLLDKYKFDESIDYILRNKRFNFRSSDTCTFNVRGSIASIYYGDEFERKINFKTEALYAGLFYHCDGLISCKNLVLPGYFLSPECYLGMFSYCSNLEETFSNFYTGITCEETAFAYMFFKCTSLTKTVEFPDTELYPNLFFGMYYGCSNLTDIIGIESYTLIPKGCFSFTFSKCDSLETIPDISSFNTINENGCLCMFSNCSGLVEIPDLHFPIVYEFGVAGMFYSCSNLETIGSIVFDNIYYNGAEKMFSKCISLVNTESVYCNNNNSYDYCYAYMFSECTSLVNPPELPQQKLSPYCYYKMFYKCINLLSAPTLNATTGKCGNTSNYDDYYKEAKLSKASKGNNGNNTDILSSQFLSPGCYESMFEDCILLNCNITLPADKVYNRAYYKMFKNCSSLINMPLILAKEVGDYGCAYMFSNCTSLRQVTSLNGQVAIHGNSGYNDCGIVRVNSYNLLSSTREININSIDNENIIGYNYSYGGSSGKCAYSNMFEYCTSLTTMPDLNIIAFAEAMCYKMFYNCTSLTTVKNLYPLIYSPSCFANMFENCISITSTPTINYNIDLEDFFDEYPSDDYSVSHNLITELRYMCSSVEEFENLDLSSQGILDYIFYNSNRYKEFSYIFYETFKNCTSLTTINNIYIFYPYTEIFRSTFENCTSLVNINNFIHPFDGNPSGELPYFPDRGTNTRVAGLPYTNSVGNRAFYKMFYNCTSLTRVPIDFINFSNYYNNYQIFESMFENCTSLIQAPEILDNSRNSINRKMFYRMFKNCTSLPEIKINILDISNRYADSFAEMFYNCSSLNKIYTKFKNSESDILQYEFSNWVYGVSSTGIFYEDFNYPWDERGVSYIPENWEIIYYGLNLVNSEDSNIFLSLEGDTYDIEIYSENSWSITSSPDWLTTNIVNNGNRYYTLTISASLSSLDRTGTLILVDNVTNETLEILIYQTSGSQVEYIEVPGSTSTVTPYKIETNFRLAQNQNYKIIISYYIPKLVDSLGIFKVNGSCYYLSPTSTYYFKYYQIRFQNGNPNSAAIVEHYNNYDSASYGANIINCLLTSENQGYGSYYKYSTGLSSPRNNFPYESFDSFTTSGSTRYYQNYNTSEFSWNNDPLTIFYTNNPFGGTRLYGIKIYTGDNYSTIVFDGVPYMITSNDVVGLFDKVSLQFYTPTTS